jgi:signal transduction histidine kinase
MTEEVRRKELLLETHYRLVDAIMYKTDNPEEDLRNIMLPEAQGYGTGKHELYFSCEGYIEIVSRVFGGQLPKDAQLHIINLQTIVIDNVAIVHGPYEIVYNSDGVESRLYMRRTVVYCWKEDRWRAIHLHASNPSPDLIEGESWPVEALKAQKVELEKLIEMRTEELNRSIKDLKATQAQLIHSEKMASLGELTAGIAHEIQNPLNFINNFSELNTELIDEMLDALTNGHPGNARESAKIIKENEQKINEHGRRADAIVKGMLQHSRSSSGIKEPTDINVLADKYLRLSYHGLRAKDKSFNATLKTNFDETIGNINIIPQDIGRVILNLITNAFYAVAEKKKEGSTSYEPTITVATKSVELASGALGVSISVADNGNGIPPKVIDKIFQPFFTTKPTGKGTGLGLSMSYDIVTKGHNGELTLKNQEREGAEFIIILPK